MLMWRIWWVKSSNMQHLEIIKLKSHSITWLCGGFLHLPLIIILLLHASDQIAWLLLLPACFWLAFSHFRQAGFDLVQLEPPPLAKPNQSAAEAVSECWQLCNKKGEIEEANLKSVFLHPWLTIMNFQAGDKKWRLVVWPNTISQPQARAMRRLCALIEAR